MSNARISPPNREPNPEKYLEYTPILVWRRSMTCAEVIRRTQVLESAERRGANLHSALPQSATSPISFLRAVADCAPRLDTRDADEALPEIRLLPRPGFRSLQAPRRDSSEPRRGSDRAG